MVPRVTVVAVTAAVAVLACASFTGVQAIAPEPAECPAGTVIPSVFRCVGAVHNGGPHHGAPPAPTAGLLVHPDELQLATVAALLAEDRHTQPHGQPTLTRPHCDFLVHNAWFPPHALAMLPSHRIRHYNGQEDVWVTDQCDPSLVQAGDCEGEDFQIGGTQYWVLADNGRDHEDKVPCTSDYEEPLDDSDSEYAFLTADYGFDSSSYDQTLGVTFDTTYSTGLAFFDNTALNDNVDIHTDGSNIDNSWDALDLPPSSPFSVDGSTAGGGDITFEHHNDAGFADSYNDYWADAWTPTNSDGVVDGFYGECTPRR